MAVLRRWNLTPACHGEDDVTLWLLFLDRPGGDRCSEDAHPHSEGEGQAAKHYGLEM